MSLEDDVKALTTALTNLTAKLPAMGASTTASAPSTAATATRGPGRPRKVAFDEVKVVAKKLMDEKGAPVAKKLIANHVGAEGGKLADLDESKYAAFIAEADILLAQQPAEQAESDL